MKTEKIKECMWKVGLGALVAVTLLFAVLAIGQGMELFGFGHRAGSARGSVDSSTNTITVNGTGDVTVKPDVATFSFSVTETAKTVTAAQDAATTKTNAALKALSAAGVADNDVKTTAYNINPHYDYQTIACAAGTACFPNKSVITGYDVSQTVEVKVRDLSKAGDLFQTVGSLGVQSVDSLQFSVDKPDAIQDQARSLAIADARSSAVKLASELGVTLVRIVSFSETNSAPYPYPVAYGRMMLASTADKAAPQVPAGDQKISSTVQVTYEIR